MRGVTVLAVEARINVHISTHTPHAGRDHRAPSLQSISKFLLTRPMRGVTADGVLLHQIIRFLLTRPMRGVTVNPGHRLYCGKFLLTRPMRGVTRQVKNIVYRSNFYSHAPCGA